MWNIFLFIFEHTDKMNRVADFGGFRLSFAKSLFYHDLFSKHGNNSFWSAFSVYFDGFDVIWYSGGLFGIPDGYIN